MIRIFTKVVLFLLNIYCLLNAQIYVSPGGDDNTNPGTFDQPFKTITKAISVSVAGDTIYVRGGTYTLTTTIQIPTSKNGTSSSKFYLFAYTADSVRPVLDFSSMLVGSSNRGIYLKASYWHIRGIDINGAGDNGMIISGSNNIVEFCSFFKNRDTGLQLGGGASNNQIINCDSYYNADPGQGNADGFAPKLDVGTGNYFYGCRSWQNSDDGWDGYLRPRPLNVPTTTLENCWTFMNGYLENWSQSTGNGNGFKMGGSDSANLAHNFILKKCLAFDNRVKGFDQNNNRGSMTLYNCTGYRNLSKNYSISGAIDSGKTLTLINCLALGAVGSLGGFAVQLTNSWLSPFTPPANTDFISVDTIGVRGPRKVDGSLPDITFMHLESGSQFVDAGTDVGLPYNGIAPDIGAFETSGPTIVNNKEIVPALFKLSQNYPNPFNPSTTFNIEIPHSSRVEIAVYNILGKKVRTLLSEEKSAGSYTVLWNGLADDNTTAPSGIYFFRMLTEKFSAIRKIIMMK